MGFLKKVSSKIMAVMFSFFAAMAVVLSSQVSAHASDIDDLFTAFNITGLQSNVKTLLIGGVAFMVLFLGYRFLKTAANRF